jgi:hypothetical protein
MANRRLHLAAVLVAAVTGLAANSATAVEISDMKGFEALFGRYAPGGDCAREPRVLVDATGIAMELKGATDKSTKLEYAASFGGPEHQGKTAWFFPFSSPNGWPVIMAFNADEKDGLLTVEPHDEGWAGGPKLSARHQALVAGSPYRKCR